MNSVCMVKTTEGCTTFVPTLYHLKSVVVSSHVQKRGSGTWYRVIFYSICLHACSVTPSYLYDDRFCIYLPGYEKRKLTLYQPITEASHSLVSLGTMFGSWFQNDPVPNLRETAWRLHPCGTGFGTGFSAKRRNS